MTGVASSPDERASRAARLETQAVFRHADEAYRRFSCPASAECCQLAARKRQPWLWLSEWRVLEARLRRDQRTIVPRADGACPLLSDTGRCTVYEDRPFGCRTFFCERVKGPAQQPTAQVNAMLMRLERVSRALDSEAEPKPILAWLGLEPAP
jgi:uncharacterized protein